MAGNSEGTAKKSTKKKTTDGTKKKRGAGKPFQPGQSGNPSGRPKIPEDVKQAFKEASMDACNTLISIANDKTAKDADRVRAAEAILDRAWGKPTQALDVEAHNIPQIVFVGADDVAD